MGIGVLTVPSPFNCACAIIDIMAKVVSLLFMVNGRENRSWASTLFLLMQQTMNMSLYCCRTTDPDMPLGGSTGPDINTASGGSTSYLHQFDPRQQHHQWLSLWLWDGAQTTNLFMVFGGNLAMDINTDPGCSSALAPARTQTSSCSQVAVPATYINMALGGNMKHRHHHSPQQDLPGWSAVGHGYGRLPICCWLFCGCVSLGQGVAQGPGFGSSLSASVASLRNILN